MNRLLTKPLGVCFALCLSLSAQADQAVLIGGGYNLGTSQGQIELNVQWVQDVLNKTDMPVITYFTDGSDPGPDVHYAISPEALDEQSKNFEALSRVFGQQQKNLQKYKTHSIENVNGSTNADTLKPALEALFKSAPDEPTVLVYNGHGAQSSSTPEQVTMELWDDTSMTAEELHGILENSNAPTRFVFTQCYSGGFHRIAYKNPSKGLELSDNLRCGFTAVSAYSVAEGCSASINTDDYRDYTSFFFAALSGYERDSDIISYDPDTNRDGVTSLREAHMYTLIEAQSTDISRSTSEDYLSRWEPWHLKWLAKTKTMPSNEYAKLFRDLAKKHDLPLEMDIANTIREMQSDIEQEKILLDERRKSRLDQQRTIQSRLISRSSNRWPALLGPYTAGYEQMAASGELQKVSAWLAQQDEYAELVQLQLEDSQLEAQLLEADRNITQMQKLLHYRKLANLKQQLYDYGSSSDINNYETLLACEESPIQSNSILQTSND